MAVLYSVPLHPAVLDYFLETTACNFARREKQEPILSVFDVVKPDGAALVYTSAKDGVNCGLLHRYLLSCLYPEAFPCRDEGQVSHSHFL